jgi:SecD/SecF fusion protein
MSLPQVKALLPRDIKLMWGVKAIDPQETTFALYAIKANTRDGKAPLDGGSVVEAREGYAQHGSSAEVSMTMNASGARTWARLTADNVDRCIAIVLDGYVYSAPVVHGEISGGQSSISGQFTINEARDLANVLKSGKLPAPARITQDTVVGPSLGQESINAGMMSFILAFVLVLIYMIFYYNRAGWVASVALICNLFFLFGVLVSFGAVLTLPGIAGIVLTMGMAVDANVIIYERIKEELRMGKTLAMSVAEGYKNAMSAIIDGNVTTLITGIVLFIFGTGPVQGFATTLIIGIITSLFTAILITRLIFVGMLNRERKITFSNKFTENFLANTKFNFIDKRKITYVISGIMLLITLVSLGVRGMSYGVDFSGGRAFVVRFDQPVTANEVREALGDVFTGTGYEVKQFGQDNQMRIVTQYKYDDEGDNVTAEIEDMLYKALSPLMTAQLTEAEFLTTAQNPYGIISSDKVGPSVAHDIKVDSVIAVLFSLVAIALYIIIRFKRWQWGVGSVISLTLDALFTIGLFSLLHGLLPFNLEVDQSFIAAILTIIGYSINDKVVIFDRIREYQTLYPKRNIKDNINNAINSTLTRTINTSGTTLVVLLAIFLFGGEVIRGFVFALLFGVLISTYSTVFTATPIAYDLIRRKEPAAK